MISMDAQIRQLAGQGYAENLTVRTIHGSSKISSAPPPLPLQFHSRKFFPNACQKSGLQIALISPNSVLSGSSEWQKLTEECFRTAGRSRVLSERWMAVSFEPKKRSSSSSSEEVIKPAVFPEETKKDKIKSTSGQEDAKNLLSSFRLSRLLDDLTMFVMPREKGDIRDVTLICLSFAVLVYISQRLVCAYCAFQYGISHY